MVSLRVRERAKGDPDEGRCRSVCRSASVVSVGGKHVVRPEKSLARFLWIHSLSPPLKTCDKFLLKSDFEINSSEEGVEQSYF